MTFTEQETINAVYSDLYKEINGIRPRHFGNKTYADIDELYERQKAYIAAEELALQEEQKREAIELALQPNKYESLAIMAGYSA